MGKTLYLECNSGIAGDMLVAALLDLGASEQHLREALANLNVGGFEVRVSDVQKNGVRARDFDVLLDAEHENHDHDMAWLYGHLGDEHSVACCSEDAGRTHEGVHGQGAAWDEHEHGHRHKHGDHAHVHDHGQDDRAHEHADHDHAHDNDEYSHSHEHEHHHHHEHRSLADVLAILDGAQLSDGARDIARRVFEVLAQAEAQAHGTTAEQVHFHEVGAVDSIVDIVGAAVCLDDLDVEKVIVPYLCEGTGTVHCAHGILPVPVPAVCATVRQHAIDLRILPVQGELVTPTGAAIVAAVRTSSQLPASMRITATGLGAGKRDNCGTSGILRAHLIEQTETLPCPAEEAVWKLECDVDDCTGEALGYAMGKLLDAGAREAHFLPVYTKKNRPAWQIQVICDEARRKTLESILFENTTTIGIRRFRMERTVLPRKACTVETPLGSVAAKQVTLPDGTTRAYPEHDGVAALADKNGLSYQDALREALRSC